MSNSSLNGVQFDEAIGATVPDAAPYHNGSTKRPAKPPVRDRMVIAWDLEGITFEGHVSQSSVLFGCSASPPLVVQNEGNTLSSKRMIDLIFDMDEQHPHALHVGYGFGHYDVNMLLRDFPEACLRELWNTNRCKVAVGGMMLKLRWIPGKWITISRYPLKQSRTNRRYELRYGQTVTIYDYASFFQAPFLDVAEELLRDELSEDDKRIVAEGKSHRGGNSWLDMPQIIEYWSCEIQLIRRVFERFRAVMVRAGFELKDWYGPGALANYIVSAHGMREHLVAAQTTSGLMPDQVHEASKYAFAGGRFEQFKFGRISQQVNVYDINSAYPFALSQLPSFAEGAGEWVHVDKPEAIEHFGVYRITYQMPNHSVYEYTPGPLFFRDPMGGISFPPFVRGWYMSPEAKFVSAQSGCVVHEGWVWRERDATNRPWSFVREMYETRQRLGKENLLSLPFKLGPNSLYGKLAQTVGWDEKHKLPPRSHALILAAWVTSYCRAMVNRVVYSTDYDDLISVETDSVITTGVADSRYAPVGKGLGQWSHKSWSEIISLQSGLYLYRILDGPWKSKSRGLDRNDLSYAVVSQWLSSLVPLKAREKWRALRLRGRSRFVGLGAALRRGMHLWRSWEAQDREIDATGSGKRVHHPATCPQCNAKMPPNSTAHELMITPEQVVYSLHMNSRPRQLPWEGPVVEEVMEMKHRLRVELDNVYD